MRLTTLVELLEREIGASPSARSQLALMMAERGQKDAGAPGHGRAVEPRADGDRSRQAR